MKILHFSTWATGGAAKAAIRLSDALVELGHESKVVQMSSKIPAYIDAVIGKLTNDNNPIFHSYNFYPDNFAKIIKMESPDIIHIHWIGAGFVRPESLSSCKIPIVWTLHDLWPLLGAEHLPLNGIRMQDGYLADNRPKEEQGLDLNRLVWERKQKLLTNTQVQFISPSESNYDLAKKAKLMNNQAHVRIPNFVDQNIYKPSSSQFDPFTIFCPAMNMGVDRNKGIDLLFAAINMLDPKLLSKIKVVLAGIDRIPEGISTKGIKVECLGTISNEIKMASLYQKSNVVVVPSRMENLPYAILESLSCGTPVVAFNVGGIPELVIHNQTGYLAKPYDTSDLVRGITKILSSSKLRSEMSTCALSHVKQNFSKDKIVREHLALYKSLLNR